MRLGNDALSHQAKAGVLPIDKPQPRTKTPSRLSRRVKPKAKLSAATRALVWHRSGGRCACGCGGQVDPLNPACWHHVFPKQSYPELIDNPDNIVLVTVDCHANHETAAKRLPMRVTRHAARLAEHDPAMRAYLTRTYTGEVDCPNPKCDGGEVPGGSKGYMLCPDCKGGR